FHAPQYAGKERLPVNDPPEIPYRIACAGYTAHRVPRPTIRPSPEATYHAPAYHDRAIKYSPQPCHVSAVAQPVPSYRACCHLIRGSARLLSRVVALQGLDGLVTPPVICLAYSCG